MAFSSLMGSIVMVMFSLVVYSAAGSENVQLVRGVELKLQQFFSPNQEFKCFDGSKSIPFSSVNDDYCDCPDGTDEPGTPACPEGRYYCYNIGYTAKYIPSSRVNDGICDCCDGSDEYDSGVVCFNECEKYGIAEQELKKEEMAEILEGSKFRDEYIQSGKEKKNQKTKRIETINGLLEQRRKELEAATAIKESAETPEKEAKDKHRKEWEEKVAKEKDEEESDKRNAAFDVLDVDADGWISIAELLSHKNMESDMTEEDAKIILNGETRVDREGMANVWKAIKPKYRKDGRSDSSQLNKSDEPPSEVPGKDQKDEEKQADKLKEDIAFESHSTAKLNDDLTDEDREREMSKIYGEDEEDEGEDRGDYKSEESYLAEDGDSDKEDDDDEKDDDDDDEDDKEDEHEYKEESKGGDQMPDYDNSIKQLIEVADRARAEFDTIDKNVKQLEKEKKDLEEYVNVDFGPHEEFSVLKGECYELNDREYTYKLCPFESVTQKNKDGGSETSLGDRMMWVDKGADRYNIMKYEGGQTCWNGPARSTIVHLSCGKENRLTSVGEPSRCEYEMSFKTPALCKSHEKHDEL